MDLKAYWKEVAKRAGVEDERLDQVVELLDKDEELKTQFSQNFKTQSDYSRDLDSVRDKAREETRKEVEAQYSKWYEDEQAKYKEYVSGLSTLKKYEQIYGPLEGGQQLRRDEREGTVMTQDQINQLVAERFDEKMKALDERQQQRDQSYIDLLEIREEHLGTFKKPLKTKEFEEFWKEHPEYGAMRVAYEKFVGPELEQARQAEFEAKMEARYQEGLRDGSSRGVTPADHGPRQFSPLFDQKEDVQKMDSPAQDKHSREAFFEGFDNPDGETEKASA